MRKSSMTIKKCTSSTSDLDGSSPHGISRRGFLQSSALVVLPAICAGCTSEEAQLVELPIVSNKTIAIPLADFPELNNVGGSVVGRASGYANPIVIARVRTDQFAALDAVCTHERCTVGYNALNLTLDCPCHGSTYEVDGRVITGPAVRALATFTAHSDGTTLTITLP
jgi:Rieske Fe-S protein